MRDLFPPLKKSVAASCLLLFWTMAACAEKAQEKTQSMVVDGKTYTVVTITAQLDHPWAIAFLPDSSFLVTQRSGKLLKISHDGKKRTPISGLPTIVAEDQGGLLDLILHPNFRSNRTLFISYSANGPGGTGTEVARAELRHTKLVNVRTIFKALPKTPASKHYGCRMLMAPDGKLLITLGEKTIMQEAQNRTNHLGSIIRVNPDGSVPRDNPFIGSRAIRPEIYTYGNRNIQGIALHPLGKEIWFHEHGPLGGDELNILKKGANYGWPLVTYGIDYNGDTISTKTAAPGIESPLLHWTPCIAPSGMLFYTGDRFPEWKGNLFIGSLVQFHLRRIVLEGKKVVRQQVLLGSFGERIRDVRQGPDGLLYLLTDSDNGRLLRIEPAR